MQQYFRTLLVGTVFLIAGLISPVAHAQAQQQACVMDSWGAFLAPDPQNPTMVEQIKTEKGLIWAFEFDGIAGEFGKVFLFLLEGESCFTQAVSFGSYADTNLFAVESGDVGPDGRIYHADLYAPQSHSTLGFYKARPTYEQARKIAMEILQK